MYRFEIVQSIYRWSKLIINYIESHIKELADFTVKGSNCTFQIWVEVMQHIQFKKNCDTRIMQLYDCRNKKNNDLYVVSFLSVSEEFLLSGTTYCGRNRVPHVYTPQFLEASLVKWPTPSNIVHHFLKQDSGTKQKIVSFGSTPHSIFSNQTLKFFTLNF